MSRVSVSPQYSAVSSRSMSIFGSWKVKVYRALTTGQRSDSKEGSSKRPEGMSMDMTVAGESLMNFTSDAKPPIKGSLSPVPNKPSITSLPAVSVGGSKRLLTSEKRTRSLFFKRSLLSEHSALSRPRVLIKKASTS